MYSNSIFIFKNKCTCYSAINSKCICIFFCCKKFSVSYNPISYASCKAFVICVVFVPHFVWTHTVTQHVGCLGQFPWMQCTHHTPGDLAAGPLDPSCLRSLLRQDVFRRLLPCLWLFNEARWCLGNRVGGILDSRACRTAALE